ncbi:peptide/nickel transport system permease protein [Kibdelosporangium banguiense]|uniref:Peptide/nickel transport system permease protein n=1 Tax=Kibdelosporangium banguiense TaxID=1365924 RepID=A0ABS4TX29_9PSEU|nr:ABC transporter permease [Kibdelosporangium banguiense]MBP2328962.1 peptide/nickel transport system permease protein [Kibdelosporangium banguiense]
MAITQAGPARTRPLAGSPWPAFIARRAVSFVVSLFVIVTGVYFMSRALGGDAVRASAGPFADPAFIAQRRAELGLDESVFVQYVTYLRHIVTFDFGESISLRRPAIDVVMEQLPATVQLGLLAFIVAVLIAVPLGMMVAARSRRREGRASAFHFGTGLLASIPDFLIAISLIAVFAITLRWLPPAGADSPDAIVLPVATVAIGLAATLSRIVYIETSRILKEDYVRSARAMRLPWHILYGKHVLPNVLTATITFAGLILAALMGGMIITETVFAWPGIGRLVTTSVQNLDYTLLQTVGLVIAVITLSITFVVDVLLALLDPRSLIVGS